MTFREEWAEGPKDQPEFRPACPKCGKSEDAWFVGVHQGREMFQCLRCGEYYAAPDDDAPRVHTYGRLVLLDCDRCGTNLGGGDCPKCGP
jgi:hypothetical protein